MGIKYVKYSTVISSDGLFSNRHAFSAVIVFLENRLNGFLYPHNTLCPPNLLNTNNMSYFLILGDVKLLSC